MVKFFKETLWSGLFVVLVLGGVALVLQRILDILQRIITPIEKHLPIEPAFPYMWSMMLLVLLVLLAGLALRIGVIGNAVRAVERQLANQIPLFRLAAGVTGVLDEAPEGRLRPALIEDGDKLVPGFLVELTPDGWAAVFLPESGGVTQGTTALIRGERVRLCEIPLQQFLRFLKRWGAGADAVLRARCSAPLASPAGPRD